MDATKYFKIAYYSEVTFPKLKGLMGQIVLTEGEPPFIKGDILIFKITKTYAFEYLDTNKTHEIFKAQSCYEIPTKDIISKEDLYEFYKDAEKNMFTALNHFEQKSFLYSF